MKYTKELHDSWRRLLSFLENDSQINRVRAVEISALLDEIDRLQAENRWIPVSERLPEDNDYVIVTGNGVVSVGYFDSVMWWSADDLRLPFEKWRHFPQPPEEQE